MCLVTQLIVHWWNINYRSVELCVPELNLHKCSVCVYTGTFLSSGSRVKANFAIFHALLKGNNP